MLPEDFKKETDSILDVSRSLVEEIFLSLCAKERYCEALHKIVKTRDLSVGSLKQIAWEVLR